MSTPADILWNCTACLYTKKSSPDEAKKALDAQQDDHIKALAAKQESELKNTESTSKSTTKKKFKWSVAAVDEQFRFKHESACGLVDLHDVSWTAENVKGVERSDKGSEGLFFVDSKQGALVLKRSKAIGSECYCTLLALKLGIRTPLLRVLDTNTDEGITMLNLLSKMDKVGRVRTTLYEQNYLLALSYLRGKNCNQIDYVGARELFGAETDLSDNGVHVLRDIGKMLALDVLVNNCDRLPLIWSHRGNPGNLMFDTTDENTIVYSIDGQIIGLDEKEHEKERASYIERVRIMLQKLKDGANSKESEEFRTVRDKFREWFEYDIGEAGSFALQEGFMDVVRSDIDAASLKADLTTWENALRDMQPPLSDVAQIRSTFVLDIWIIFQEYR